jgi:cellulose biosynthesis protein BcsQ
LYYQQYRVQLYPLYCIAGHARERQQLNGKARVVTFTSRKGGVGKTVCATLLARYLAEVEGKQVVVVDFDASCGVTSVFYDKLIGEDALSIVELLQLAANNTDIQDAFAEAVIPTGAEDNPHWENTGGHIYLLPSKESLDRVLALSKPYALREVLSGLDLNDDHVFLVDTGPELRNVEMGIIAADVVFLPIIYSRQDVYPAVDTLRAIIQEQRSGGNAVLGGLVVNVFGGSQWEGGYENNFLNLFESFQQTTGLMSTTDRIIIHLKRSRLITRGKHLDWSFRKDFLETARAMAAALNAFEDMLVGAS